VARGVGVEGPKAQRFVNYRVGVNIRQEFTLKSNLTPTPS
jgi:hypothetical protein